MIVVAAFINGAFAFAPIIPIQLPAVALDHGLFDTDTEGEQRKRKADEMDLLPFMKNVDLRYRERPQIPIATFDRFGAMIADSGREYSKTLTHMYSWEIAELAQILDDDIKAARETKWRKEVKNPGLGLVNNPGKNPEWDALESCFV